MRIELRDEARQRIGRIEVDPAQRPTRVTVNGMGETTRFRNAVASQWQRFNRSAASNRHITTSPNRHITTEVFLNWDTALDDAGQLRKCIACNCTDLFREKAFPQVTAIIVALAFVGAVIGALGLATNMIVLTIMAIVLVIDVAILVFSRRRLVCYRCRTTYHDLPIARYHRAWDRAVADRYAAVVRPEAYDQKGSPAPSSNALAQSPRLTPQANNTA
jgi:hypothetical protein